MDCKRVQKLISLHIDGLLTERERADAEAHLGACQSCAAQHKRMLRALDSFTSLERVSPPQGMGAEYSSRAGAASVSQRGADLGVGGRGAAAAAVLVSLPVRDHADGQRESATPLRVAASSRLNPKPTSPGPPGADSGSGRLQFRPPDPARTLCPEPGRVRRAPPQCVRSDHPQVPGRCPQSPDGTCARVRARLAPGHWPTFRGWSRIPKAQRPLNLPTRTKASEMRPPRWCRPA